jgi:Putative DNA-binding domain
MQSLRDTQRRFVEAVFSPKASIDFVAGSPAFARDRMAIYRRTIFANYHKALSASYPVVKRLTGAPFFHAAVEAFAHAQPSQSGDLNIYGESLGEFLATYPPAADLPYLADVARLEWAIDEAHRAGEASCAPESVLAALAVAPPDRLPALRLRLEPSCRLVASPFPIFRIWKTNQPDYSGDDRVMLDEGGDALLIRRGDNGISLERLAVGDHAWLAGLAAGATLGAAIEAAQNADATFDLGVALREQIAAGTIIAVIDM